MPCTTGTAWVRWHSVCRGWQWVDTSAAVNARWILTPPPPCPGTTLRKNQPLVPRSNSRITFFTRVVGFSCFWWM